MQSLLQKFVNRMSRNRKNETKKPATLKSLAVKLDRLYREKDAYQTAAFEYAEKANKLPDGPEKSSYLSMANDAVAWAWRLDPEITRLTNEISKTVKLAGLDN